MKKSMKVLLYLEGKSVLEKSGIGRALHHQMHALDLAGIPYTTDILGDYDVVHINTYGPRSLMLLHAAKRRGKKVIMHAIRHVRTLRIHSSVLTFWLHFLEILGPHVSKADYVITPSEYSKNWFSLTELRHQSLLFQMGLIWKKYGRIHVGRSFPRLLWYQGRTASGDLCGSLFPTQGNWRFRQGCRKDASCSFYLVR